MYIINTCSCISRRNHLFSFYLRIKVPKLYESVSNCDKIVSIFWEVNTIYFAGYFIASNHWRCLQVVQYQHRNIPTQSIHPTHKHPCICAHTETHLPVPYIDHHIMLVANRHKILQIGRECLQENTEQRQIQSSLWCFKKLFKHD